MDGWMDFYLPHLVSSLRIPLWSLMWSLDLWGPFADHRVPSIGPGPAAPLKGAPEPSAGLRRRRSASEWLPQGQKGNKYCSHLMSKWARFLTAFNRIRCDLKGQKLASRLRDVNPKHQADTCVFPSDVRLAVPQFNVGVSQLQDSYTVNPASWDLVKGLL